MYFKTGRLFHIKILVFIEISCRDSTYAEKPVSSPIYLAKQSILSKYPLSIGN
jgi:hypothetical protein